METQRRFEVQTMSGKIIEVYVSMPATVWDLKWAIYHRDMVDVPEHIHLAWRGGKLDEDNKLISEYGVQPGQKIFQILWLRVRGDGDP